MDTTGSEAGRDGVHDLLDKFKGLFLTGKEHGARVPYIRSLRPSEVFFHMTVALDTGDRLDAVGIGIIIEGSKLLGCVSASHISEVGAGFHTVNVLGVKHHHIVSHNRKYVKEAVKGLECGHCTARNVKHQRQTLKVRILKHLKCIRGTGILHQNTKLTEEHIPF